MEPVLDLTGILSQLYPVLLRQLAWMIGFFVCAVLGCYALYLAQMMHGSRVGQLNLRFENRPLTRRALLGLRRGGRIHLFGS